MQRNPSRDRLALPISTEDGEFIARYSENGLCELRFPETSRAGSNTPRGSVPEYIQDWHALTVEALKMALKGEVPKNLPPLDLSVGTDFQVRVWEQLLAIKSGCTLSYAEVAKAIDQPKAVRAVGGACGANPIPVFVPCHRVLAANHKIGGFSSGLDWKRKLLAREGSQGSWF